MIAKQKTEVMDRRTFLEALSALTAGLLLPASSHDAQRPARDPLGDVLLALEDLLKDNPESDASELVGEVDGKVFRVIRTDPEFQAPGITLLYYVDGNVIMVWGIHLEYD